MKGPGAPFRYRAYGLAIDSEFAIDELDTRETGPCDLSIRAATVALPATPFDGFRHHEITLEGDLLAYRDVGRFLVRDPAVIEVDVQPQFDARLIGLPLLGPVMACRFHRSGSLVLHGSAVAIGGEVHVFLGDKGQGKSTTAAALVAAGFPLLSDDVVVLDRRDDGAVTVRAAYPTMKLDKEMMAGFPPGSCHVLEPDDGLYTGGKSRVRLNGLALRDGLPLGTVHCLSRGAGNAVEPLPRERVLHALIRFSHHPRLGPAANTPAESAEVFTVAAKFAPLIRGDILTVKDSLDEIARLGEFLSPGVPRDVVAA
jgi:hypothetical protein